MRKTLRANNIAWPAPKEFFRTTGAKIKEEGNRAFYRPSTDEVTMPPFRYFKSPDYFYSVLAHEIVHNADHRIMPRPVPVVRSVAVNRASESA